MKVVEIAGDMFSGLSEGDVIAHGCNSMGVMGAGVAKVVREKFPQNYKRYTELCDMKYFMPGSALYYEENGIGIYNLGTQYRPGPDANIYNIRSSVKDMLRYAAVRDQWVIRTVRLGCGIGGLMWEDVKPELEKLNHPVELHVYYQ